MHVCCVLGGVACTLAGLPTDPILSYPCKQDTTLSHCRHRHCKRATSVTATATFIHFPAQPVCQHMECRERMCLCCCLAASAGVV